MTYNYQEIWAYKTKCKLKDNLQDFLVGAKFQVAVDFLEAATNKI